jgi:hypothetical protein
MRRDSEHYARFALAEVLGCFVSELDEVDSAEFTEWAAYFGERHRKMKQK